MTRTLRDGRLWSSNGLAKKAAKFVVNVVLPTPPFRLAIVRMSLSRFCNLSTVFGGCRLIVSHSPGPCSFTAACARATLLQQPHQGLRTLASQVLACRQKLWPM